MTEYTKDEALAFIEAMRLTIAGRVGFKWMVGRLADLSAYVTELADENERLKARLGSSGAQSTDSPQDANASQTEAAG